MCILSPFRRLSGNAALTTCCTKPWSSTKNQATETQRPNANDFQTQISWDESVSTSLPDFSKPRHGSACHWAIIRPGTRGISIIDRRAKLVIELYLFMTSSSAMCSRMSNTMPVKRGDAYMLPEAATNAGLAVLQESRKSFSR